MSRLYDAVQQNGCALTDEGFEIPLRDIADRWLGALAAATGAKPFGLLDGATLLGERAMMAGLRVPCGRAAGGGCRLFAADGGTVGLNLARPDDRELLPALFGSDDFDPWDDEDIAARIAGYPAAGLVRRGRSMGLALAAEHETARLSWAFHPIAAGTPAVPNPERPLRVLDLSALWAGPLAAHLLWLAGADVVKLESLGRPDAMRQGDRALYAVLNQGKASVVLDFAEQASRAALLSLIATADIVIEAARPRALAQLDIDVDAIVRAQPGLIWMTITGHGAAGEAAGWVGFGDDCGIAGGLTAALRDASGAAGFVGDAIADPLTGIFAALAAWLAWEQGVGGRFGVSMSAVAGLALAQARAADAPGFRGRLRAWAAAAGQPFPTVRRRPALALPEWGVDTRARLATLAPC